MAFEEDFSVFFNTDGFGVPFTYTPKVGASITGVCIFDDAYYSVQGGDGAVAGSQPQLQYEAATIEDAPEYGEKINVKGKDYTIVGIQADGTGVTTLILEVPEDGSC